jgi:hypothetical protein
MALRLRSPSPIARELEREFQLEPEPRLERDRPQHQEGREVTVSTPYIRIHRHDLHSSHAHHAILRLYRDLIRREQERPRPNITSIEIGPEDDHSHVLVAIIHFADGYGEHDREWRDFWNSVLDEQVGVGSVRVHTFSPIISMQRHVSNNGDGLEENIVRRQERSRFWAPVTSLIR